MKNAKRPKCEICGNDSFDLITTKIREGKGRILKCDGCGLIIQDLNWSEKRLKDYYGAEYQRTNSLVTGRLQRPKEHFEDRLTTVKPIFEQIKHLLKPKSRVMEVGCGAGSLLSLIKPHILKCVGTELYKPFVDFIKKDLGIEAYAEDINRLKLKDRFDLVISIATLDHLPNPYETLLAMKRNLSTGGKIYVEVPSCEQALNLFLPSPNKERFNEFFWHRAHLFYFDRSTIRALFKKAGLKVKIDCRHDYTMKNFLNWYFLGKPQSDFVTGLTDIGLFPGKSDFESRTNELFDTTEKEFKKILAETFRGDNLCCVGWL